MKNQNTEPLKLEEEEDEQDSEGKKSFTFEIFEHNSRLLGV